MERRRFRVERLALGVPITGKDASSSLPPIRLLGFLIFPFLFCFLFFIYPQGLSFVFAFFSDENNFAGGMAAKAFPFYLSTFIYFLSLAWLRYDADHTVKK